MIKIANPCDADWQTMQPQAAGRFCSACEKVVVDFSKMSDVEIKDYFTAYRDQKTCGRFLTSQVDRPLATHTKSGRFSVWLNQIPITRAVLLLFTSTSIWLSSCVKNHDMTTGEPADTTEANVAPIVIDTLASKAIETTDTSAATLHKPTTVTINPKLIDQHMHMTTGNVIIVEPEPQLRKIWNK